MATRTRYRRSRTSVAFGGAFWRFDPASQTPGAAGGASFAPALARAADDPAARATIPPAPARNMNELLTFGGRIVSQLGGVSTVEFQGNTYTFDANGNLISSYSGTTGAAGAGAGAGATTSRQVGSQVTARTASGATITGQVTGVDAQGNTIVRWEDGTVATYNPQGQMVNATPAPGTTAGTTTGGTATGGTTTGGTAAARQVGQSINATLSSGQTITGQITAVNPDGTFSVQWADGATSTYSAEGQHIQTLPANTGPAPEPRDIPPTDLTTQTGAPPPALDDTAAGGGPKPTAASVQPDESVYGAPIPPRPAEGTTALDPGVADQPYAGPPSPAYYESYNGPTAPQPAPAPAPVPEVTFADALGNPVNYAQLIAGFSSYSAPSTLQIASTLAAPDISAPTPPLLYPSGSYPAFDAGQYDAPANPGVTDIAPPNVYAGDAYLTE